MALRLGVPKRFRSLVRVGTTSWKYDSWKGLVYDPAKSYEPGDYLADYAKVLDSVEVDQWFYSLFPGGLRLPDPSVAKAYAESVPEGFVFTVKAPNSLTLTNYYSRQTPRYADFAGRPNPAFLDLALLGRFLESVSPLGTKLGPIMFQFEYLNRQKMASLETFLERLGAFIERAPRGYRYAVEVRNPKWMSPAYFKFLEAHGLGFVYVGGYFMPGLDEILETCDPVTAPFQIVRLHGSERAEMESRTGEVWDRIVTPKPEGLAAAARVVKANAKRKVLTYVNISNHYEGSAPLTIRRFLDVLGGKRIDEAPF
jgi:uncharacterized protein YecE (DUF72 family)